MNYENKLTGKIISQDCYNKLPLDQHANYVETIDTPTHYYESVDREDDDSTVFLLSEIVSDEIDQALTSGDSCVPDSPSVDFCGGGASGSW